MNHKKIKIGLLVVLLVLIGIECFFYFHSFRLTATNDEEVIIGNGESIHSDNEKYIADILTGYYLNALTFQFKEENGNLFYYEIKGLKDTEVENKINERIKEVVHSYQGENQKQFVATMSVEGNFENVLSLLVYFAPYEENVTKASFAEFASSLKEDMKENRAVSSAHAIPLNFDLTTGNALTIQDIVVDTSVLKKNILASAYEYVTRLEGFICEGGPCLNPEPDYSHVEDDVFSIANQFDKGNYSFYFTEERFYLTINDVLLVDVEEQSAPSSSDTCQIYKDYYDEEDENTYYETYVCKEYITEYAFSLPFYKIADSVILYDKFKTETSIFTGEMKMESRKFYLAQEDDSMIESLEEEENQLIDYNLNAYYLENKAILSEVKNSVLKESLELQTDHFNVYNYNGNVKELGHFYYVYFIVYHYDLNSDVYLDNKKQIYLDKFEKYSYNDMYDLAYYKEGYAYLEKYLTKKSYYFYVYDKNGKEVSCRNIIQDKNLIIDAIPDEWLKLGQYKTKQDLFNSLYILPNEDFSFPDRLVLIDDGNQFVLTYKGKEVLLAEGYEAILLQEELYR